MCFYVRLTGWWWLRSAGCSTLRQWDLTRAVPRHVRDVALVKGDILGLATAPGRVFTAGADGAIRRAATQAPALYVLSIELCALPMGFSACCWLGHSS